MGNEEQDLSYLLEPYQGLAYTSRNATEKSKTANALVASFLASPGSVALVRLVSVSKREHQIYLRKHATA